MRQIITILIAIFWLSQLDSFSQGIRSEYNYIKFARHFLKIKEDNHPSYTDKIILFNDSTFTRRIIGTNGMFVSYEDQGNWEIVNDSLFLFLNKFRIPESDTTWVEYQRKDKFLMKYRSIIPVYQNKLIRKQKFKIK